MKATSTAAQLPVPGLESPGSALGGAGLGGAGLGGAGLGGAGLAAGLAAAGLGGAGLAGARLAAAGSAALGCATWPRPLNISSIRSVTATPPTMLRVARITATRARVTSSAPCASLAMIIAPTRITPWIALLPDMSGVCRMLGTLEITSKPTNADNTKIISRVTG
jgi:hypothetical protein